MRQFFGLNAEEAKLEFALCVLTTMPGGDLEILNGIFAEATSANVLDPVVLTNLQTEAKSILPVKLMYGKGEEIEMKKFQYYRDKILMLCKVN